MSEQKQACSSSEHIKQKLRMPSLEEIKKRYVLEVLEEAGGKKSKAARILGIDRKTLYRWLKSWGIKVEREVIEAKRTVVRRVVEKKPEPEPEPEPAAEKLDTEDEVRLLTPPVEVEAEQQKPEPEPDVVMVDAEEIVEKPPKPEEVEQEEAAPSGEDEEEEEERELTEEEKLIKEVTEEGMKHMEGSGIICNVGDEKDVIVAVWYEQDEEPPEEIIDFYKRQGRFPRRLVVLPSCYMVYYSDEWEGDAVFEPGGDVPIELLRYVKENWRFPP